MVLIPKWMKTPKSRAVELFLGWKGQPSKGPCGSLLLLSAPCSTAFQPNPSIVDSLETRVAKVHPKLSYIFWHLEKRAGCVEKPGMVTRRWRKSDQQGGPWPWLVPTPSCSFFNVLDFSTNHIVVGARGGQPCSKMSGVCINFFFLATSKAANLHATSY